MVDRLVAAVSRTTLRDQVTSALRDMVLSRQLAPGSRVVQTEIAKQLGVSRMPVRDAISRLSAEGLLTLDEVGGSATVADVQVDELRDSYEVQATILALIGRRAAERITPAELDRLDAVHAQMSDVVAAGDRAAAAQLNRAFHRIINLAARSPRLIAMLRLSDVNIPHSTYAVADWPARAIEEHADIVSGLRRGQGGEAAELLRRHVTSGADAMISAIVASEA